MLVAHTPAQMFHLVDDVERCRSSCPGARGEVISRQGPELVASLHIDYLKIRQHFTTRNYNHDDYTIDMTLVDGLFEQLSGGWRFIPLGDIGCKIEFRLNYEFSSKILEKSSARCSAISLARWWIVLSVRRIDCMATTDSSPARIAVEVVYALPERQTLLALHVPVGTTAQEAVALSGLLRQYPELIWPNTSWACLAKSAPPTRSCAKATG